MDYYLLLQGFIQVLTYFSVTTTAIGFQDLTTKRKQHHGSMISESAKTVPCYKSNGLALSLLPLILQHRPAL